MYDEKKFNINQYADVFLRRKWLILLPALLIAGAAVALAYTLPKIYRSSTLILVEPQKIPRDYVRSTITASIQDRLNTIKQQILSRTRLESVIKTFDLYGAGEGDLPMEQIVGIMRRSIEIEVRSTHDYYSTSPATFSIHFMGREPMTVMNVTNALASMFIEENLRVREKEARGTSEFLEEELTKVKASLEEQEAAIRSFKQEHMGELPEQQEPNLNMLNRLQLEKKTTFESLRSAEDRRVALMRQIHRYQPSGVSQNAGTSLYSQLMVKKTELANLESRYTDKYPDVVRLRREITEIEEELRSTEGGGAMDEVLLSLDPAYQELRGQLDLLELESKTLRTELARIDREIATYQRRVEQTPMREQQLMTLTRDYENIKENYNSLLNKKLNAEIAENLELRRKSEQFRILDPASFPEHPFKPRRRRIMALGLILGLGMGIGAAFFAEYADRTFRDVNDVKETLMLPVLTVIPFIATDEKVPVKDRVRRFILGTG